MSDGKPIGSKTSDVWLNVDPSWFENPEKIVEAYKGPQKESIWKDVDPTWFSDPKKITDAAKLQKPSEAAESTSGPVDAQGDPATKFICRDVPRKTSLGE